MNEHLKWPARLWIVRHGESLGNVANGVALAARSQTIDVAGRDMDVLLSDLGREQASVLGAWFSALPPHERPEHILSSTYARARETAEIIEDEMGTPDPAKVVVDERLREKELGALNRLTRYGIEALHPEQWELRSTVGKFYYRPPGGESWCDVILRLRSALDTICLHYAGKRLVIVCHHVVVLCFRYLLERMNEAEVIAIDSAGEVKNCAITEYVFNPEPAPGGMSLTRYNFVAPLRQSGTPVTAEKSAQEHR